MSKPITHWTHRLLERSGLHALTERYHRELQEHENAAHALQSWKAMLVSIRHSAGFPMVIGVLAILSSGTGTFPFVPVLVAAVVFAPLRWRAIYLASALGAAAGAGALAVLVKMVGGELAAVSFIRMGTLPDWLEVQKLVEQYSGYALAVIAALPVPQTPVVIAISLTKTSPWLIALAVLAGKLAKYGAYILGVQWILRTLRHQKSIA